MQRELNARLTELERLNKSGKVSDENYALALRERRGKLLTNGGRLARQRKRDGILASEIVSREHSVPRQVEFQVIAPEIRGRDALIKLDRKLVKDGFRSMLVKVIKGKRPAPPVTVMAQAMQDGAPSIFEQIKAALTAAE